MSFCYPKPSAFIYGCISGSFVSGPGREAELADRITKLTGVPAVTTSTAIPMGLRGLGARKLFMLTRYVG